MQLLHNTAIFPLKLNLPEIKEIELKEDLRIYSLTPALIYCSPKFFSHQPMEARAILSIFSNARDLLYYLLKDGHSTIEGRLCGAFKNIGKHEITEEIKQTMESAGYKIREEDPFTNITTVAFSSTTKPSYCHRLEVMWHQMRKSVIDNFPKPREQYTNTKTYLAKVEESFTNDAYHSLSIEGYQVNIELINRYVLDNGIQIFWKRTKNKEMHWLHADTGKRLKLLKKV